jgi:hypothetical protein
MESIDMGKEQTHKGSLEISVTRQISTILEYLLGSIVLQSEIGSTVLQILQNHGINDT